MIIAIVESLISKNEEPHPSLDPSAVHAAASARRFHRRSAGREKSLPTRAKATGADD